MAAVGPVPVGTAVGHRARGLLRRRRRLGLLPLRPVARPRLPVGRGRPGRHLRPLRLPQPRRRAVERPGPDPQGAAVRADQRRGQPRRGRQGVLVGARRHARRTPGCAGSTATRRPSSRTSSCAQANAARGRDEREYELADTGVLDDDRFFDVTVTYAKAAPGRLCDRDRGHQPRPRPGAAAPAAAGLVPQHLGLGPRRPPPDAAAARRARPRHRRPARGRVRPRLPRPLRPGRRGHARRAGLRQRDQRRRAVRRRAQPHAVHEGRHRRPGRAR